MQNDLPVPEFGRQLIGNLSDADLGKVLIVTQEIPWQRYGDRFQEKTQDRIEVKEIGLPFLDSILDRAKHCDTVIALGGGLAIDSAKYLAWKNEKKLITIPTAISADVAVCRAVAIREDWRVHYIGDKMPDRLLIDFDIIQSAPPQLNRGGICDILSCYTALEDWEIAHADTGEKTDSSTIAKTRRLLERLFAHQEEIYNVSEAGIRFLMEGYLEEVKLCEDYDSPRPEEGSEHFFAYNLEHRLRRPFPHGTIVSLGVVLMTLLQERDPKEVVCFIDRLAIPWRPEQADIRDEEIVGAIETLYEYCQEEDFYYTVIHRQKPNRETGKRLLGRIREL